MADHNTIPDDEILDEYDLRGGVRGKYAARYAEGTSVVLLGPDVSEMFPNSDSVNQALRENAEQPHNAEV